MIVSSSVAVGHAQRDGRHYVVETHRHDDGRGERIEYGPVVTDRADLQAVADDRAAGLNATRAAESTRDAEAAAAREKASDVLTAAVTRGEITEEELRRAGAVVSRAGRAVGEIEVVARG